MKFPCLIGCLNANHSFKVKMPNFWAEEQMNHLICKSYLQLTEALLYILVFNLYMNFTMHLLIVICIVISGQPYAKICLRKIERYIS